MLGMAESVVPLLQCGGGALRALLGLVGPAWARFAQLLHPVGYCRVGQHGPFGGGGRSLPCATVLPTLVEFLLLSSSDLATWTTVRRRR